MKHVDRKISKDKEDPQTTINQFYLTDIYRTLHPTTSENTEHIKHLQSRSYTLTNLEEMKS